MQLERGAMPSLIAWLDSTPEEQRAARELIALFSETESRDELGIGQVRDAFSDLLFPGTSVLQTRARYFLFVPWCYTTGDAAKFSGRKHYDRGRAQERQLITALRNSPAADKAGLIGARAGVNVINLPSDIYWNGLVTYGIREYGGSIGSLNASLGSVDGTTELTNRAATEWNRTIPAPPDGFPDDVPSAFSMTYAESAWLRERLSTSTQGTVLAHLLDRDRSIDPAPDAPWYEVSEDDFEVLHHAHLFSTVMHGAALLYNLIIAERYTRLGFGTDTDLVRHYTDRVDDWIRRALQPAHDQIARWSLSGMWQLVKSSNPNLHPRTQRFVEEWVAGLRRGSNVLHDQEMRNLVEVRERRKGSQSRMQNDKLLAAWSGASGAGKMTYRWGNVRTIINDIHAGLGHAGA